MLVTKRTLCRKMRPSGPSRLRALLVTEHESERGDTLIEVLVSAVILALIVVGTLTGVDSANRATSFDRARSQADVIAQQDEERMRSEPIMKLSELSESHEVIKHEVNASGTKYYIASTAKYVANLTDTASCTSTAKEASYIQTTSTVTSPMLGHSEVVQTGIISPPPDSALIVRVENQSGEPVPNMEVSAAGTSDVGAETSIDGCAILAVKPGEYTLNVKRLHYVDENGYEESDKDPSSDTPFYVVAEQTIKKGYKFAPGGALAVKFENPVTGKRVEGGDTFVAANTGMNPSFRQFGTVSAGPVPSYTETVESTTATNPINTKTVFPFASSYTVYAGTCEADKPPSSILENPVYNKNFSAVVLPGLTNEEVTTLQPPVDVKVMSGTGPGAAKGLPVSNATVRLEDTGCKTVRESRTNSEGELVHPGIPFGKYKLCVTSGPTTKRKYTTTFENNTTGGVEQPAEMTNGKELSGTSAVIYMGSGAPEEEPGKLESGEKCE